MSQELERLPNTREVRDDDKAGVFITPEILINDQSYGASQTPSASDNSNTLVPNIKRDSGYKSATSESDISETKARFYISQTSCEDEEISGILLETNMGPGEEIDYGSDVDDESFTSGSGMKIGRREVPVTAPVDIPGASQFIDAHDQAYLLMHATPPRSYMNFKGGGRTRPSSLVTGNRVSSGCLSESPSVIFAISQRRGSLSGALLERGIQVTSGQLHASSSRADSLRQRTISENVTESSTPPPKRDRSQSVPDIGMRRRLLERKCAEELRKISDEFFSEVTSTKGRASRASNDNTPVSKTTRASSSYPGTGSSRQSWWQTIIQNYSPAAVRRASIGAYGVTMTTIQDSDDNNQ